MPNEQHVSGASAPSPVPASPKTPAQWHQSAFWRVAAVGLILSLFYIGHGLAQAQRPNNSGRFNTSFGGSFGYSGSYEQTGGGLGSIFEHAAFADNGQLAHIRGDVDAVVTTIDDGATLLVWIFGPEVSGVPKLDKVVRYDSGRY